MIVTVTEITLLKKVDECTTEELRRYAGQINLGKIRQEKKGDYVAATRALKSDLIRELKAKNIESIIVVASPIKQKKVDKAIQSKQSTQLTQAVQPQQSTQSTEEAVQPQQSTQSTEEAVQPQQLSQTIAKEANILDILGLTKEEKTEVESAIKATRTPLNQLIKEGLLLKARKINTETKKLESMTLAERKQTTMGGAAIANLQRTTDAIIRWNHSCYNKDLRIYLNASILRSLTGSNLNTIKDFLGGYRTNDEFVETSEQHNSRYGLTEGDNRKGRDEFGNRVKISDLIRNAYLPLVEPQTQIPVVLPETDTAVDPQPQAIAMPPTQIPVAPQPLDIQAIAVLPPEEFALAVDGLLKPDVKTLCLAKMNELRRINEGKSVHTLKKLITPIRKEFEKLKLNTNNIYHHEYETPRTVTDKWQPPQGAKFSEDRTKVLSEPRHQALEYLVLNAEENEQAKAKSN